MSGSAPRKAQVVMAPEINLVDPDVYQRGGAPHGQLAWLREHAPVFWHADGGGPGWPGFWAITRHADIGRISRHPEIFSSAGGRGVGRRDERWAAASEMQRRLILNMAPPRHNPAAGWLCPSLTTTSR